MTAVFGPLADRRVGPREGAGALLDAACTGRETQFEDAQHGRKEVERHDGFGCDPRVGGERNKEGRKTCGLTLLVNEYSIVV